MKIAKIPNTRCFSLEVTNHELRLVYNALLGEVHRKNFHGFEPNKSSMKMLESIRKFEGLGL